MDISDVVEKALDANGGRKNVEKRVCSISVYHNTITTLLKADDRSLVGKGVIVRR